MTRFNKRMRWICIAWLMPWVLSTAGIALADVVITVDPARTRPISPWIYGVNAYQSLTDPPRNLTLNRAGGNRWTAYNWENNASNAGSDWGPYSNDDHLGSSSVPGESVREIIAADRARSTASLITVQMQGFVAADKEGKVNASDPNRFATRFKQVVYQKGSPFTECPSALDGQVHMDEYLWFLRRRFPGNIYADPSCPTFVSLDNEPELWDSTHREIQPQPIASDEFIRKSIRLCRAMKALDPAIQLFGPVHFGFNGLVNWRNAPGYSPDYWFTDHYLRELRAASEADGRRLLDVYTLHWYSEARVGGARVIGLTGTNLDDAQIQAIVQSPRSLWDPTFRENSWIADHLGGPIRILDRLQSRIATNWPGTRLAITEYWNGGDNHIAGAIAQADNLGIFGSHGVFAAASYPTPSGSAFALAGYRMFRDYDGRLGAFGDISVLAVSSDVARVSAYVSQSQGDRGRFVAVLINRSGNAERVRFQGLEVSGNARIFRIAGRQTTPLLVEQRSMDLAASTFTLPALSISTIEILRDPRKSRP